MGELHIADCDIFDGRFHDIAWGRINDDYPRGIIAGALENGSLDIWNAEKLLKGARSGFPLTIDRFLAHNI